MSDKPLVTIITPAYNCAKFLPATIESVLNQDYKNIEYHVLDDGSTDDTLDILFGYEHSDSRMKGHSHKNRGEHKTVNEGLKLVRGKYFMYPNADDPLLPGAITKLVEFMEANPDVLCAYPDWDMINEDGGLKRHIKVRDYDFRFMVSHHTCLCSVGCIFRSTVIDIVGWRDPQFRWVSDFDYWLRIGLAGKMAHVPYTLAQWRVRDGQGSGDKSDKRSQDHIRLMHKFYSLPNVPKDIVKVKGAALCWVNLVAAVVTDSKIKAIRYLITAFCHRPIMLLSIEFWDIARRRALHYLRR